MIDTPEEQAARRAVLLAALKDFNGRSYPRRGMAVIRVTSPCPSCDPYIPSRVHAGLAPEAD